MRIPDNLSSFEESLAEENRADRAYARALVSAAASGDAQAFMEAVEGMRLTADGWRYAMLGIARLASVSPAVQAAFRTVWIEHKRLPQTVGNRRALANALKVLFPPMRAEGPMELYRGTRAAERRHRLYGFSWTTDRAIAERFAQSAARWPGGGIVITTVAPPEAVLLIREDEAYYDEREVVVDPFRLRAISVAQNTNKNDLYNIV